MKARGPYLLLSVLGALFHHVQEVSGSCLPLPVPSFGQLLYNNVDVTQSQPQMYSLNDTVEYRCAQDYQLVSINSNTALQNQQSVCISNRTWSLLGVTCQFLTATAGPPSDDLNLLVPARDALIIIGAVLGALILLLLLLVLCCCCWTMQLRSRLGTYRHDEALIHSQAEGLVVPNPIIDIKESEDDLSGNPLYLTPTEMNKFNQQRGKLTR
ncbi:uncharacterized protein LOC135332942 [Halichondria panicea]|uniref:uncharacterized protein LOC135332942 n=1 Tax=Halichondria panicea TaxID=6063 RepID=UPI00312B8A4E